MERQIRRGDIYCAILEPVIGSEQGGKRPVVIISNDIGNRHSPTVIISAITGKTSQKPNLPTHYPLKARYGLNMPSTILLEQIRTIDKSRLKEYLGTLDFEIMKELDQVILVSLGIKLNK